MRALIFMAILLISMPAHAQEPGGFRGMIWGVSKEDVRQYEKAVFYKEEGDTLYFIEQPGEFRRLITYDFAQGKLIGGKQEYVELHDPNPKTIMDMFGARQLELEKIHGEPEDMEFRWKDKTYLYHPEFWARALRNGSLHMTASWQMHDTRTTLETYHDGMFYQVTEAAIAASPTAPKKPDHVLTLPGVPADSEKAP